MISPSSPFRLCLGSIILAMLVALCSGSTAAAAAGGAKKRQGAVWVVFFSEKGCGHCTKVDDQLRSLEKKYPVRVRRFSIDRPEDYALFTSLEAIHSDDKLAVPLVMLGESILVGEGRIGRNLEKTVRRLARSGGSGLPYLGTPLEGGGRSTAGTCSECERRPPTLGEEWGKIKKLLDERF